MPHVNTKMLLVAGIMTGNSLDAIDIATFRASLDASAVASFQQVAFHSHPCSHELRAQILALKNCLRETGGRITTSLTDIFSEAHATYHQAVNQALAEARLYIRSELKSDIDLIGFHGQTLGHAPPSIMAKGTTPYTIQLVDGGAIADAQNIVTVADFRSDDLLNGGEGAPFAPGFNALLAPILGIDRAIFINAGNTSNLAIITSSTRQARGWDCGPCNEFPGLLMREEQGLPFDRDGSFAFKGMVRAELLPILWDTAVIRADGSNALEIEGQRSFDPQWYRLPPQLRDPKVSLQDRMRTVVAFSAYCIAHSLAVAIKSGFLPQKIVLSGGGWKNPLLVHELKCLCNGSASYILPKHKELFSKLQPALHDLNAIITTSDDVGLPSNGMEAGIFAFAALQRILNKPFTHPSFTHCTNPTVCGAIFIPRSAVISPNLRDFAFKDQREFFRDPRLSRAAPDNLNKPV